MERRGEGLAPVSFLNQWSSDVFRRAARGGEYGIPIQGRGPLTLIWTGNRHEHCPPGAGRPEKRKESVSEGTCRQREMFGQSGVFLQRLRQPREGGAPRIPGGGREGQLKCAEQGCKTLEMAVETVEIQERCTRRVVPAMRTEESEVARHLKVMGEKLEALLSEIKDD